MNQEGGRPQASMTVKSPWVLAIIPSAVILVSILGLRLAIQLRDTGFMLLGAFGIVFGVIVARTALSPRVSVGPDGIRYRSIHTTMMKPILPWSRIETVEFKLISGFRWPNLVIQVREQPKAVYASLPLVKKEAQAEMLGLIEQYLEAYQGPASKNKTDHENPAATAVA